MILSLSNLKRCFKCGAEKSRSDFYRHPQMADGLCGKCKDCAKYDVRLNRQTNPRVREYDRRRASQPHRIIHALADQIRRQVVTIPF